jgi:hypothetical protein
MPSFDWKAHRSRQNENKPKDAKTSIGKKQVKWFTPVLPATQKEEIRRIMVRSQPSQNNLQDSISKKPFTKKGMVERLKV